MDVAEVGGAGDVAVPRLHHHETAPLPAWHEALQLLDPVEHRDDVPRPTTARVVRVLDHDDSLAVGGDVIGAADPRQGELPAFRAADADAASPLRDTAGEYVPLLFLRDGRLIAVTSIQDGPENRFGFTFRPYRIERQAAAPG
jgi:hypothetical protein